MRKRNKGKISRQAGITLVALVITIIVIIILSSVTLGTVFGDDGIIKKAQEAKNMADDSIASEDENMNRLLDEYMNIMSEDGSGTGGGSETPGGGDEDTKPPTITNIETSSTENSITVTVTATDESGLADSETYTYFLDNLQQGVATTENTKTYTGLQASKEYTIKVVVKDKYGNEATEERKVSTTDPAIPDIGDAKPNPEEDGPVYDKTTTIVDDLNNQVVIPGEFHLDAESGTKVEEGIVIEDDNGNQFVWIPVGTYQTSKGEKTNNLSRRIWGPSNFFQEPTEVNGDEVIDDYYYGEGDSRSSAYEQIGDFKDSVNKNGGFYIGRYEQGERNVCKKGLNQYLGISRDKAKNEAEAMCYAFKYVESELISSYAWDTALNFICQNNAPYYTLATTTESYYGNIGRGSNDSFRRTTGGNADDNYCNIYDFLGNCREWTTEYCSYTTDSYGDSPYVIRGAYYKTGTTYPADRTGFRDTYISKTDGITFRVQLYIKENENT